MTRVTVLPHAALCPEGTSFEADPGSNLCEALLEHGVDIEHACEMSCACTTCHVIVREGFSSLEPADDLEEDMLGKAWGLTARSRLACQSRVAETPLTLELPKYTLNQAREGKHA
ncbi:MAG: ISC system 2Fe-2S type ferredoxin [Zoogloeaceae bacterium]|jgi:2Fe-2S ferredoxin|nr:ISC system 2Fe-2S type ferredoxin [Zoogloeaceae bacterium]